MSSTLSTSFELRGQFCGFTRTLLGKRRMVLRVEEKEHFLKVEKALRQRLQRTLIPGSEILAIGHERAADKKRVVDVVKLMTAEGPVTCAICPIRVCTKKTCWRNGGKELWQALEAALDRDGLSQAVQLEGVHCLDHCNQGPNVEWQGHNFHHCKPQDTERIVAKAAEED